MTEESLLELIRQRHSGNGWACFTHVPDATGLDKSRTADAIAMSLYPSRGLEIHGFECKVARSDWLKELSQPDKAEAIAKYCDRWWIVATSGVVKKEELPKGWGLLVSNGSSLRQMVHSHSLNAAPLDRSFVASLFRKASEAYNGEAIHRQAYAAGLRDGKAQARENKSSMRDYELDQFIALKRSVDQFETASGVKITRFHGDKIGSAVAKVMACEVGQYDWKLSELRRWAENTVAFIDSLEQRKETDADRS